jgi:CxxC-x17-CxxC domain-containing protein
MAEDIIKKAIDTGIAPFAVTTYRNKEKIFGIKTDDRRRHVYIVGKTGTGKTTLIENLVYSDIIAGRGICYVDPHGDTAEKMLEWIPNWRINDVIYFNPADIDFPISFNVLEKVDPHYRHLVASGLIGVFKKLWADSWGPRLEYILRHAILALLEYPDSTLLGINRLLVDKVYRKKVVEKIQDPVVRSFWMDEFPKWNERVLQEVVSPIQNKVGQFLSTALIRNIVGQVKSTVNLREVMDSKKILILNLSKGRIGEDASALMGAMMVTKIQLAAMSRVDIPEEERNDFYLYVDEFQNFATDSFANILSEARKYHLNLTIAHQYIEQLGEVVQPAVFGNVGTMIVFRIGAADAEFLEQEFAPNILPEDLVNLPKYHIYLKLMIDGVASEPFSARGLPPVYSKSFGNEEKVIRASRERYTKSRDTVEDKIMRWSMGEKAEGAKEGNVSAPIVVDVFAKREEGRREERRDNRRDDRRDDRREQPRNPMGQQPAARSSQPQAPRPSQPSQMPPKEQKAETAKPAAKPGKASTKPMYNAVCDSCGKDVEVPFEPDKSRAVYCKDCLKKSRRGEMKIKPEQAVEASEEKAATPAISLAEIGKQTVDFKGRAVKEVPKKEIAPAERPRIEPPPIRDGKDGKEDKEGIRRDISKEARPRIEPPVIRQPEKKITIEPKVPAKAEAKPVEDESIFGEQEIPSIQEAPKKKQGAVDLLQQFGKSDNKEIKQGEEIEL